LLVRGAQEAKQESGEYQCTQSGRKESVGYEAVLGKFDDTEDGIRRREGLVSGMLQ